ncbi:MAG TPA: (2Fe-2S)-binding protein [Acidimicrobiia bacterium]|nr:(2Fe-2S)-binding protein [Acidimicrobiia bacterium]
MATNVVLNDSPTAIDAPPDMPLLWAIRDLVGLTGTKYGCGIGICGACTVHIDGAAARSCVTPLAAVEGREITTIEGLSSNGDHPVQLAFTELNVAQCGYCQPGQLMAAADLLNRTANPTPDQIAETMRDVLCRCGTYPRILRAIQLAAQGLP